MRRMTAWLRTQGEGVHHKRVARLMQQRGMAAIYAKPKRSQATAGHMMDPYWWRGVTIARVTQVWSPAITSSRVHQGGVSLVAVMDWCSRSGLSWALSVTLDGQFGREALRHALRAGGRPALFHTAQGVQCTSRDCTGLRQDQGLQVRMDGRGRALDHVFVERLWRPVKYEEVY